jgi:hypothetical protein
MASLVVLENCSRQKEGKNVVKEEWQFYFNFLHIDQDLKIWNNKEKHILGSNVWRIQQHGPIKFKRGFARSLELKWGVIKHDVMKFCSCCKSMVALNDFGSSQENIINNMLELCKLKHLKHIVSPSWVVSLC